MKKFLSVVIAIFLIFALVGCNDVDDLLSQNSSLVSSVIEQTDTTSQVEDASSQQPSSEVSSNVSQNSTPVTTPPSANESEGETPPKEINFVPNILFGKPAISNKVLYNGTRYAYSRLALHKRAQGYLRDGEDGGDRGTGSDSPRQEDQTGCHGWSYELYA